MPASANGTEASTATHSACAAVTEAASRSPSPTRRATSAVMPIARPIAIEYSRNR